MVHWKIDLFISVYLLCAWLLDFENMPVFWHSACLPHFLLLTIGQATGDQTRNILIPGSPEYIIDPIDQNLILFTHTTYAPQNSGGWDGALSWSPGLWLGIRLPWYSRKNAKCVSPSPHKMEVRNCNNVHLLDRYAQNAILNIIKDTNEMKTLIPIFRNDQLP